MTLAAMDALGTAFALAIFLASVATYLVVLVVRTRRYAREERAARREVDGPLSSVGDFAAYQQRRVDRARFRHATRYGRSA